MVMRQIPGRAAPTGGSYDGYRKISPVSRRGATGSSHRSLDGSGTALNRAGTTGTPQIPYSPTNNPAAKTAAAMQKTGQDFLDPGSDYTKRLNEQMARRIGDQTEAKKRSAALTASRSGLGSGAGAELMNLIGEIDREGLEATGEAAADLTLAAPQIGRSFLTPALSAQTGLQGQALEGYLTQQRLDAAQESEGANIALAERRLDMEEDRLRNRAYQDELDRLMMLYGA